MSAVPNSNETNLDISVEELAERMAKPDRALQLIDVREPQEIAIAQLQGFEVLPLSEFAEWSGQIASRFDPQVETLVICHHGVRSAQMCYWLRTQGFSNARNVIGGINAYSTRIDPTIPQY